MTEWILRRLRPVPRVLLTLLPVSLALVLALALHVFIVYAALHIPYA
jgi:hypothetical protein